MVRLNITMNEDLNEKVNAFTSKYGISRSALISTAVSQYLEAQENLPTVQAQVKELSRLLEELELKAK